jgi:hypothetical protein
MADCNFAMLILENLFFTMEGLWIVIMGYAYAAMNFIGGSCGPGDRDGVKPSFSNPAFTEPRLDQA